MIKSKMKHRAAAALIALTALSCTSPALAADDRAEIENKVELGLVDISMHNYDLDPSGGKTEADQELTVMPGAVIARTAQIKNHAAPVWLRVRVDYGDDAAALGASDDMLILDSAWRKHGQFFYWPVALGTGETVSFYEGIRIPSEWTEAASGKSLTIDLAAEAVQAQNFTPDFSLADPWYGTVIEKGIYPAGAYDQGTGSTRFQLRFEGGAQGLVSVGQDFFANWPKLMPGDSLTDQLELYSAYNGVVDMWFQVQRPAEGPSKLDKVLGLKIWDGKRTIYDGPMSGAMSEPVLLASLGQGERMTLSYTVDVPADLDNSYSMAEASTVWTFTAQIQRGEGGHGGVQTGDDGIMIFSLSMLALSVMAALVYGAACIRRGKDGKQK